MLKVENTEVFGWEAAIRGMRNPMNSWHLSDTGWVDDEDYEVDDYIDEDWEELVEGRLHRVKVIGEKDLRLMKNLSKAGDDHGKFLRYINVTVDITAPLYWWKEFDTYKVGTVANSCSTMHKIQAKEFTLDDFSTDHLNGDALSVFYGIIGCLNANRTIFNIEHDKEAWWKMIQLLPSSYNQKRTVQLNYQVLKTMYFARRNHKLDEWHTLCEWMETLPCFKEICVQEG